MNCFPSLPSTQSLTKYFKITKDKKIGKFFPFPEQFPGMEIA